ncbi:hypothetical protein D9M72_598690 [compost metagenome]
MIIFCDGTIFRIAGMASKPPPGMEISMSMISGPRRSAIWVASSFELPSATISKPSISDRLRVTPSRNKG